MAKGSLTRAARALGDLATAVVYLVATYYVRPVERGWSTADVLELHSRSVSAVWEEAKLERLALRAEMAAERAARQVKRGATWAFLGAFLGYLSGAGLVLWMTH